jgi:TIR domain
MRLGDGGQDFHQLSSGRRPGGDLGHAAMADIFISYAKAQAADAAELARELGGLGYDVWWDTSLLPTGTFAEEIDRQLNAAGAVIVIWSTESVRSKWVRSEAAHGDRQEKLVNTHTPGLDPGKIVPKPFDQIHSAPVDDIRTIAIAYLIKAGLRATTQNAGYIGEKECARIIARGEDPETIATRRVQKRLMDITAGIVERRVFVKKDPIERMVTQIAHERIQAAIAAMPTKPDKDKVKSMTRHLIKLQGDELRQEAEARIAQTHAIGSALIEKLMQEGDESDDDAARLVPQEMEVAA